MREAGLSPGVQPLNADERSSIDEAMALQEWRGHSSCGIAWEVHRGDVRKALKRIEANRFHCVVTSPPYYSQRDYLVEGQIGLEPSIQAYVDTIAESMDEVRRVMRHDALLFLNLGDTYYSAKGKPKGPDRKNRARRFGLRAVDASGLGVPRKTIIGIPWRVALEMISRGWILRAPVVWKREGSLPEPTAKDRPWRTYEFVFMFSKSPKYYFDRSHLNDEEDVWTISKRPRHNNGLHSAAFPEALVEKCLNIGCPSDGEVLDPFSGTGTTLGVAVASGRPAVGIDIKDDYCKYMRELLEKM